MNPQDFPTLEQFSAHMVTAHGKVEVIRQPLFDYLIYDDAGTTAPISFFAQGIGAGQSSSPGQAAGAVKTPNDTNLQTGGALPAPQAFWVDGIEVDVQPGGTGTVNTYVSVVPTIFAAAAASTVQAGSHDVNAILSGGVLRFSISNKQYYTEGPLMRFPPSKRLSLNAALGSTSATVGMTAKEKLASVGDCVKLDPGLAIVAQQSFGVVIQYPTAIACPSTFNARVGVILNGWLFRPVQ